MNNVNVKKMTELEIKQQLTTVLSNHGADEKLIKFFIEFIGIITESANKVTKEKIKNLFIAYKAEPRKDLFEILANAF